MEPNVTQLTADEQYIVSLIADAYVDGHLRILAPWLSSEQRASLIAESRENREMTSGNGQGDED
jgi:hypothetical protein